MRKGRFSLSWPPDLAHLRFPFGHCQAIRTHRLARGGSIIKRNVTHRILPRREEPALYPPTTTARPRGPLRDREIGPSLDSRPLSGYALPVSRTQRQFLIPDWRARSRLPHG